MTKIEGLREFHMRLQQAVFRFDSYDLGLLLDYIEAAEAWLNKPSVLESHNYESHSQNIEQICNNLQVAREKLGLE